MSRFYTDKELREIAKQSVIPGIRAAARRELAKRRADDRERARQKRSAVNEGAQRNGD